MNKKYVWELWKKCTHPHPKYGGGDMVFPMEFAELIIKECIDICEQQRVKILNNPDDPSWTEHLAEVQTNIKQHFGVE